MINKISIIGAGAVGSSVAYNLLSRSKLRQLALIDIAGDLARGVALDLEDTRGILKFNTEIVAGDDYSLISGSDIVVVSAGIARKDGMSRADLFNTNASVAKAISVQLRMFAADSIVIAVTNPLDAITYVLAKETKFLRTRVMGMGSSLDLARMINIVSNFAKEDPADISGLVFGVHSNEMIVSADRISVKKEKITDLFPREKTDALCTRVKMRGGEIVSLLKNRSAHFAPGLAVCSLVEAIISDTKEIIPVSLLLDGEYGLKDVCMGLPCRIGKDGISEVIQLDLAENEKIEIVKVKKLFQELIPQD